MRFEEEYTCLDCNWSGVEPLPGRETGSPLVCPVCSGMVTRLRMLLSRGEVEELLRREEAYPVSEPVFREG